MSDLPLLAIHGAGNIGLYVGGRLRQHTPVRFLGRPSLKAAIQAEGLALSDSSGWSHRWAGQALDFQTDPAALAEASLILVCVKSAATAQAAGELAAFARPGSVIISLQNGLENAARLQAALPSHTVLAGMVPFNVVSRAPGVLHQASGGTLMIADHPARAAWQDLFDQAGLPVQWRHDMPSVLRAKLLFNLNNAINALSDLPLREQLSQRAWRRCLAVVQREALAAFATARLPVARLTPLPPRWLPHALELPDSLFAHLAPRMLAIDPLARSSTWEDLRAGRTTEVDALQGAVVRLAQSQGLEAAANMRLMTLLRDAECGVSRTWTAQALLDELKRAGSI
ncbi:2-dehydropantoate 2-reductase [Dyella sp.]|uniref:2-dehydropantoate 2-reductase n=1 Tax=Dyella sp. TaxID=1869338 RepID=UPI002ED06310